MIYIQLTISTSKYSQKVTLSEGGNAIGYVSFVGCSNLRSKKQHVDMDPLSHIPFLGIVGLLVS
jgi:hypothetical protein